MLKIGQKTFLRRVMDRRDYWHNCRVDDLEQSKLIIAVPLEGGDYLRLKKDEEVEIGFVYRDEFYCVLARVEGVLKSDPPTFFITVPTQKEVYLKKRRDAERVDVLLTVRGTVRGSTAPGGREIREPVVLNLSRSGMLLSADEALAAGDELDLKAKLGEEAVGLKGSVLGRMRGPSTGRARYQMRVMFTRLDDRSRKILAAFIKRTAASQHD